MSDPLMGYYPVRDWYTSSEAAQVLGITTARVRQYLYGGELSHAGYCKNHNGRVVATVTRKSVEYLKELREARGVDRAGS